MYIKPNVRLFSIWRLVWREARLLNSSIQVYVREMGEGETERQFSQKENPSCISQNPLENIKVKVVEIISKQDTDQSHPACLGKKYQGDFGKLNPEAK